MFFFEILSAKNLGAFITLETEDHLLIDLSINFMIKKMQDQQDVSQNTKDVCEGLGLLFKILFDIGTFTKF